MIALNMKMPLSIRLVLGWFAILIVATLGALGYCLLQLLGEHKGIGPILTFAAHAVGCLSFPIGFFYGVIRRKRAWVDIPYLIIGATVMILSFVGGHLAFSVGLFIATVLPVVLMNLPVSLRWFNEEKDQSLGIGCGLLVLLAAYGVICIDDTYKTWANIEKRKAYTVSVGTAAQVIKAKYLTLKNLMGGCAYKFSKPLRVMSKEEVAQMVDRLRQDTDLTNFNAL